MTFKITNWWEIEVGQCGTTLASELIDLWHVRHNVISVWIRLKIDISDLYPQLSAQDGEGWCPWGQPWQLSRKGEQMTDIEQFNIFLNIWLFSRVYFVCSSCPWSRARADWPAGPAPAPAASLWTPPGSPHQTTGQSISHVACHAGLSCHSLGLNLALKIILWLM